MKLLSIVLLVAAFGAVSTSLPVQAKTVDSGHVLSVRDVKRCQCGQSTCWSELNGCPENADSGGRLEPHLHLQGYRRRYRSGEKRTMALGRQVGAITAQARLNDSLKSGILLVIESTRTSITTIRRVVSEGSLWGRKY